MIDATSAPTNATPATSAALSESLHVLVDEPTRAAAVGLAVITARKSGPTVRPREGQAIRELIEDSLDRVRKNAPSLYQDALRIGREELARRRRTA